MNWRDTPLFIAAPLAIGFGGPLVISIQCNLLSYSPDMGVVLVVSWFIALAFALGCISPSGDHKTIRDLLPEGDDE